MHEVSIAQAIVHSVCDVLARNGRSQVSKIHLQIGKFTAVVPDVLRSTFEFAAQGTPCENAVLEMEEIPIRFSCEECQSEFIIDEINLACPNCNSHQLRMISGRELLIQSIEAK
jgi:hydrogenase nickel incorporation protein HypA/HybF